MAEEYFRYPDFISFIAIPFFVVLQAMLIYAPDLVPYAYLGPLGSLALYMITNIPKVVRGIFYSMWVIHAIEAYYGYGIAKKKGLSDATGRRWAKWIFVYGVFSLKHLQSYKPHEKAS